MLIILVDWQIAFPVEFVTVGFAINWKINLVRMVFFRHCILLQPVTLSIRIAKMIVFGKNIDLKNVKNTHFRTANSI